MIINLSSFLSRPSEIKLSLFSFLLLLLERLFLIKTWEWPELVFTALLVATVELLLRRLPGENLHIFTIPRILVLLIACLFYVLAVPSSVTCVVAYILLFICYSYLSLQRLTQLRPLFKQQTVVVSIECMARLLYGIALGVIIMLYFYADRVSLLYLIASIMLSSLYVFLFVRILHNRSLILKRYKETMLMQLAKGNLKPYSANESARDLPKMSALYQKIVSMLEETQPYLDPDYGINDLARDVFTNKTYLSKTINVVSGRNFRQFINYYRVKHSITLMTDNPKLTVEDLAKNSGFHSTVTYNMAFKFNVGDTPGEYCQKIKSKLIRKTLH